MESKIDYSLLEAFVQSVEKRLDELSALPYREAHSRYHTVIAEARGALRHAVHKIGRHKYPEGEAPSEP
jgi:hypothetical protein